MPQVALDEPGIHASFEQMRSVGMPQGMDSDAHFGDPSTVFGFTEGALGTGATHGIGSRRALFLIAPRGGKEPGLVPVGFPVRERKKLTSRFEINPLSMLDTRGYNDMAQPDLVACEETMPQTTIHACQCPACQGDMPHPNQELHRQMNVLLSRLDEQQRRWYAALEATRLGHGGEHLMSQITGLDPQTIRRGRRELASECSARPAERTRAPGGGRPRAEKKTR